MAPVDGKDKALTGVLGLDVMGWGWALDQVGGHGLIGKFWKGL